MAIFHACSSCLPCLPCLLHVVFPLCHACVMLCSMLILRNVCLWSPQHEALSLSLSLCCWLLLYPCSYGHLVVNISPCLGHNFHWNKTPWCSTHSILEFWFLLRAIWWTMAWALLGGRWKKLTACYRVCMVMALGFLFWWGRRPRVALWSIRSCAHCVIWVIHACFVILWLKCQPDWLTMLTWFLKIKCYFI